MDTDKRTRVLSAFICVYLWLEMNSSRILDEG